MLYIIVWFAALLYLFFDVNYFLRGIFTVFICKYFESRVKITDTTTIYGICFTQDVGFAVNHMNNARYVRELDFSRFHFNDRTGLYAEMCRRHTDAVQAATSIRYRKFISTFTFYKVISQLVYWDDKAFYLEQRFITLQDGFVRAVVLSKQVILNESAEEVISTLSGGETVKPVIPRDLQLWIQSLDASSEKLRPHRTDLVDKHE